MPTDPRDALLRALTRAAPADRAPPPADEVGWAYAVLHPETWRFAQVHTPRLLRHLHRTTERVVREVHGGLRGHVAWPPTLQRRWAGRPAWVTRATEPVWDGPENRTFAAACRRLVARAEAVAAALSGVHLVLVAEGRAGAASARLADLVRPARAALRDPRLVGLAPGGHVDGSDLARAAASRLPEYAAAAALFARLAAERPAPPATRELLLVGPAPGAFHDHALVALGG